MQQLFRPLDISHMATDYSKLESGPLTTDGVKFQSWISLKLENSGAVLAGPSVPPVPGANCYLDVDIGSFGGGLAFPVRKRVEELGGILPWVLLFANFGTLDCLPDSF